MNDHILDVTKMIGETPRTDAAYFKPHATMYDLAGEMKLMERELTAAHERIKRLEEMYEGEIGENEQFLGSNLQGLLIRELNWSKERIKRLEEALKDLLIAVTFADPPKEFNGVLCNEALVPIGFVDSARAALESKEAKPCIKQLKTKSCIYCMKVECECSDFDVSADMGAKG